MSAVLTCWVNRPFYEALATSQPHLLAELGASRRHRNPVGRCALSVVLPTVSGAAFRLVQAFKQLEAVNERHADLQRSRLVRYGLQASLGLPWYSVWDLEEQGFLAAVESDPCQAVNWLVYADWLEERSAWAKNARWFSGRAEIIRAWLSPEPSPVNERGVLVLAANLYEELAMGNP